MTLLWKCNMNFAPLISYVLGYRTPVSEEFAQGYPSDEEWHGYINNNDRVLLKVGYHILINHVHGS